MGDTFKEAVDEAQAAILEETEETHSPQVMERCLNPRNWGAIENPSGFSRITGLCGETMQITLKIDADRIMEARFVTDGCATSVASASVATELAGAKTIEEALAISQQMILDVLGGLPKESEHCALLASSVLRSAIEDYQKSKNSSGRP